MLPNNEEPFTINDINLQVSISIASELRILERLIRRSVNQHRRTVYFKSVRRVVRLFHQKLKSESLNELSSRCMLCLRNRPEWNNLSMQLKWCMECLDIVSRLKGAITTFIDAIHLIVNSYILLSQQVSETYYLPICMTFVASLGRLYTCALHTVVNLSNVHGALSKCFISISDNIPSTHQISSSDFSLKPEHVALIERLRVAGQAISETNGNTSNMDDSSIVIEGMNPPTIALDIGDTQQDRGELIGGFLHQELIRMKSKPSPILLKRRAVLSTAYSSTSCSSDDDIEFENNAGVEMKENSVCSILDGKSTQEDSAVEKNHLIDFFEIEQNKISIGSTDSQNGNIPSPGKQKRSKNLLVKRINVDKGSTNLKPCDSKIENENLQKQLSNEINKRIELISINNGAKDVITSGFGLRKSLPSYKTAEAETVANEQNQKSLEKVELLNSGKRKLLDPHPLTKKKREKRKKPTAIDDIFKSVLC